MVLAPLMMLGVTVNRVRRICNARTRSGGHCRRPAEPGSIRCRQHGARAWRPRGVPMHENTRAALWEGRERWLEGMRAAKAAGLLTRFPNGRTPKSAAKLSQDRVVRRAQRIIEVKMGTKPALPSRPWSALSRPKSCRRMLICRST